MLYYIVKRDYLPLTAYTISKKLGFNKNGMLKTYFELKEELDLENQKFDPKCLVPKYAFRLGLSPREEHRAQQLIEKLSRIHKDPRSVVAYALY